MAEPKLIGDNSSMAQALPQTAPVEKEEKRFFGLGRSLKYESTVQKGEDKITISGTNRDTVMHLAQSLFSTIDFNKSNIYEILEKHESIGDSKIKKMLKSCLNKSNKDSKIKQEAIKKIYGYELQCKRSGYKSENLKKAIKLLAGDKNIDLSKASNLEAVGILYAHIKNGSLKLDDVFEEDVKRAISKCIKFCETFEVFEVCSAGQEVLSVRCKIKFSGLGYVTAMLSNFKKEQEKINQEMNDVNVKNINRLVENIDNHANQSGDTHELMSAVNSLNENNEEDVSFKLMAVGVVYANLQKLDKAVIDNPDRDIDIAEFLNLEANELTNLYMALDKCIEFLKSKDKKLKQLPNQLYHEGLSKMLAKFIIYKRSLRKKYAFLSPN